jgi:hypothetical protein
MIYPHLLWVDCFIVLDMKVYVEMWETASKFRFLLTYRFKDKYNCVE